MPEAQQLTISESAEVALERWISGYVEKLLAKRSMMFDLRAVFADRPELVWSAWGSAEEALAPLLGSAIGAVAASVEARDVLALVNGMVSISADSRNDTTRRLRLIMNGLRPID